MGRASGQIKYPLLVQSRNSCILTTYLSIHYLYPSWSLKWIPADKGKRWVTPWAEILDNSTQTTYKNHTMVSVRKCTVAPSSKGAFSHTNVTEKPWPWILPKCGSLLEPFNSTKLTQAKLDWCQTTQPQCLKDRTKGNIFLKTYQDLKQQKYFIATGQRLGLEKV